jgi:hypothetical protein
MLWVPGFFLTLNASMPAGLSFIVWWELFSAALGIVATFALFLFSDFVVNPFIFAPLCFVLVWLVSAYGFNRQKTWAWNLGMATAILSLLVSPILLGPTAIIMFIPWVVIWPSTIIYLTRPNVKTFLGKTKAPVARIVG